MRYVQPLTDEQRALLEKTMQEDTAFRARSRAHSLLLSAAGTPIQAIANTYQTMAEDHARKSVGECHPYREFELQPSIK